MDSSAFKPQQSAVRKPQQPYANDSILESLRNLGSGVGKTMAKDVAGKVASDALSSLFGAPPKTGELKANQPVDLKSERQPVSPFLRPPEMRRPTVHVEEAGIKEQIEAVRAELKALTASMKTLNQEIEQTVNQVPVNPGVYHKNFLDRIRSILKVLREQIDDSRTWLSLSSGRKQKKGYWGMYKKHGTQFGLSSERTMATQAG